MKQDTSADGGHRVIRMPEVLRRIGVSRSDVYSKIRAGDFPRQIKLGARAVGFLESDIEAYLQTLIAKSRAKNGQGAMQ